MTIYEKTHIFELHHHLDKLLLAHFSWGGGGRVGSICMPASKETVILKPFALFHSFRIYHDIICTWSFCDHQLLVF